MTDTTDIKALREFLMEQIDHVDSYGGKVWLCAEDARLAMSSLDQLEAERQRADDNSAECQRQASKVGRIKHELNKAEAEIAALKSAHGNMVTRCALLRQRSDLPVDRIPAYDSLVKAQDEIAALKAKLANPVVLPERWKPCDCIDCAYAYDSEATKKAINEAGFTVKGDL